MKDWLARWFFASGQPKQVAEEPKRVGPFVPGMTLAPGEAAELPIELPPECREIVRSARDRGEAVGIRQGEPKKIGPGRYRVKAQLVAGERVLADLEFEYSQ